MADPTPISRWKKLIYGLIVSVAILGMTELLLRQLFGPPPPPVRVYNALGAHASYLTEQNGLVSASYVNPNPPAPFPAAWQGPRVAVIGGSSVHAGTPDLQPEDEFPGLISRQTGITTINLGSPGLDSFDTTEIVREMLAYKWSAIIIYNGHNDFGNAFFQARYGDLLSGVGARARAGLEHFQLFVQLHRLLAPVEGLPRQLTARGGPSYPLIDDTRWWAALRYLEANTRQVVWMAHQKKVPVILVTPVSYVLQKPGETDCSGDDCPLVVYNKAQSLKTSDPIQAAALLRRARDLDRVALRAPTAAEEAMREISREGDAVLVDAEARLPQEPGLDVPAEWLFYDGVHFTADGHKAMASLLAPVVQEIALSGPKVQ